MERGVDAHVVAADEVHLGRREWERVRRSRGDGGQRAVVALSGGEVHRRRPHDVGQAERGVAVELGDQVAAKPVVDQTAAGATIAARVLSTKALTSACSAAGTENLSRVACTSSMNACHSLSVIMRCR